MSWEGRDGSMDLGRVLKSGWRLGLECVDKLCWR
jgi:hypothetical protein